MSEDSDRMLTRLFAETHMVDAIDEAFVARVRARIARRRRFNMAMRTSAAVAVLVLAIIFAPLLVSAATHVSLLPGLVITPLQAILASPNRWITLVLLSVFVLARFAVWAAEA
jgi:hypothetical protein